MDRTTDGQGEISTFPLAALQELNAWCWQGSQAEDGTRRTTPADTAARIPSFAGLLDALAGRVGMNIPLKSNPTAVMLAEVCRLFHHHNLYPSGYVVTGRKLPVSREQQKFRRWLRALAGDGADCEARAL